MFKMSKLLLAKKCKVNKKCYFCEKHHNLLLCFKQFNKSKIKIQLLNDNAKIRSNIKRKRKT